MRPMSRAVVRHNHFVWRCVQAIVEALTPMALLLPAFEEYAFAQGQIVPETRLGPYVPRNLELKAGADYSGMDFRGSRFDLNTHLAGANFTRCDLRRVIFDGTDLEGANFTDANLEEAVFYDNVRLSGVSFRNANLKWAFFASSSIPENADLTNAVITGVSAVRCQWYRPPDYGSGLIPSRGNEYSRGGASCLTFPQLRSTWNFRHKDLSDCEVYLFDSAARPWNESVDFRGFDLRNAIIVGDCTRCDFTDADITGAVLRAKITKQQILSTKNAEWWSGNHGFSWEYCHLSLGEIAHGWDFSKETLRGMSFSAVNVKLTDAVIDHTTITNVTKEQLYSTRSYKEGNLAGLHVPWVRGAPTPFVEFDFSRQNLTGCVLWGPFTGAVFTDAVITGADLTNNWHGLTAEQIKSTWNYKNGRMAGVRIPDELRIELGLPPWQR